jgi:hypothetical protein
LLTTSVASEIPGGDDHVDLRARELGRELRHSLGLPPAVTCLVDEVLALNITEVMQGLAQHVFARPPQQAQDAYTKDPRLYLRRRGPCGCCSRDTSDNFPPPHALPRDESA